MATRGFENQSGNTHVHKLTHESDASRAKGYIQRLQSQREWLKPFSLMYRPQ